MTVAKSYDKTLLGLRQKGEHKTLSLIQINKTKLLLNFKVSACISQALSPVL